MKAYQSPEDFVMEQILQNKQISTAVNYTVMSAYESYKLYHEWGEILKIEQPPLTLYEEFRNDYINYYLEQKKLSHEKETH